MGVQITVRKVCSFLQQPVFKEWIEARRNNRMLVATGMEKAVEKLMTVSIYGKTVDNKQSWKNARHYVDIEQWYNMASRPGTDPSVTSFDPDIGMGDRVKHKPTVLDTPRYIGWAVLSIAKARMHRAHYKCVRAFYGPERCRLLYMDTDSLMYELETQDYEADLARITAKCEDYGGISFDGNRLGHFKDKALTKSEKLSKKLGRPIKGYFTAYVGLSAKLYALLFETSEGDEQSIVKARRISGNALKARKASLATFMVQHKQTELNSIIYMALRRRRMGMNLEKGSRQGICGLGTKTFRYNRDNALPLGHYLIAQILEG